MTILKAILGGVFGAWLYERYKEWDAEQKKKKTYMCSLSKESLDLLQKALEEQLKKDFPEDDHK